MLKYIASRKLTTALEKLGAPMKLINKRSLVLQDVIYDIQTGLMSPDDGAKFVLKSVYGAFDRNRQSLRH